MAIGEFEDVVVICAPESIDRLGVVAHGRQVPRSGRRDRLHDLHLQRTCILHLIDQDVAEQTRLLLLLVGEVTQEPQPLDQEVVVIDAIGRTLSLRVGRAGTFDLRQPRNQVGRLAGDDVGQGDAGVQAEADKVLDFRGPGRELVLGGEPGIVHGQANQVELVLTVEDGEVGFVAQKPCWRAEQAIAHVVKRSRPDLAGIVADQGVEPTHHLTRGPAGESD